MKQPLQSRLAALCQTLNSFSKDLLNRISLQTQIRLKHLNDLWGIFMLKLNKLIIRNTRLAENAKIKCLKFKLIV